MIWEAWPAVVFGWPAVIISLGLSGIGILSNRSLLVLGGAAVALPFIFYASGQPGLSVLLLVLPALHVGSAIAVRQSRTWLAVALLLPFIFVASLTAVAAYRSWQ